MSKSTKRHWPPPSPPDFIPEGWLPLFEAYKLVGRAQFGDAWMNGQELAAPNDEDLEEVREAHARTTSRQEEKVRHLANAKRASVGVRAGVDVRTSRRPRRARAGQSPARAPYKGPPWPLFNEEARIEAIARGDWVWNQLRQWLHADNVSQMVLDCNGVQHTPPRSVWASAGATSILHTGRIEVGDQGGIVFVSISQLEAAIHGEQGSDGPTSEGDPQEKAVISQTVSSPHSGSDKGKAAVGRPSLQFEIEDACNELITNEEANLDSRIPNYEPIRRIIRRERDLPSNAHIRGLGDEAIRKVIAPILDNALAALNEAKTAPH